MYRREDINWMYEYVTKRDRLSERFVEGVQQFLQFASTQTSYRDSMGHLRCPCKKCSNRKYLSPIDVADHLYRWGFVDGYRVWMFHGENYSSHVGESSMHQVRNDLVDVQDVVPFGALPDDTSGDQLLEVIHNEEPNPDAKHFYELLRWSEVKLQKDNNKSVLQWMSEYLAYKNEHNGSKAACKKFLKMSREALGPEEEHLLPDSPYAAEKMMQGLWLGYETIDVCENNCFLFYGEFKSVEYTTCPECGVERYETSTKKLVSKKKLWYFPLAQRPQRLYLTRTTAEHMTWHLKCKDSGDVMVHPASGEAWKHFDRRHSQFAAEPRNVRLGLCVGNFSPFGNLSAQYSFWPMFVTPYNLPPNLCMREEYVFLSLIISGPKSPGQNIDVLLRPLIDELKVLWHEGVHTNDSFKQQNFQLRAAIMWTISDFSTYGMLSQWSTHGKLSCPYCMENTKSFTLANSKKPTFWGCHRRFLPIDHEFRRDMTGFNGHIEFDVPAHRRSGVEMAAIVAQLPVVSTKPNTPEIRGFETWHNWCRRSIFWELPYWSTNIIRHNLDVLHCEKNFFDNIKGTVLDDAEKTKDNLNARRDLKELTTRHELFPIDCDDGKTYKPKATYCLNRDQKKLVFQWLIGLRFPDGYASNIRRCVDEQQLKLFGMKSNDYHVFMQRLMPIAFRDFLPSPIWGTLVEVSTFFRALCATKIKRSDMKLLEESIVVILCKLEKIFPPAFFDSMEHLTIHLLYEARVGGPVQYRWMYPFARRMFGLKKTVLNKARVECSIANAYILSEITNLCSHYFDTNVLTRYNQLSRNEAEICGDFSGQLPIFHKRGRALNPEKKDRYLTLEDHKLVELYALLNCPEVDGWVTLFEDLCCSKLSPQQKQSKRMAEFVPWFKKTVMSREYEVDPRLYALVAGPTPLVKGYGGYIVNGFRFYTDTFSEGKLGFSSGVYVKGSGEGVEGKNFYATIKDIIEVFYCIGEKVQSIVFFKCVWYDINYGTSVHPVYGLVDINSRCSFATHELFMFANQALQVYYTPYPSQHVHERKGWWAVCPIRARKIINMSLTQEENDDEPIAPAEEFQDDESPDLNLYVDLSNFNLHGQLAANGYELVEDRSLRST